LFVVGLLLGFGVGCFDGGFVVGSLLGLGVGCLEGDLVVGLDEGATVIGFAVVGGLDGREVDGP